MYRGLNSHYFHIIGDGHQPNSRVYTPIIRIPIKGEMTIPNTRSLDPGTYTHYIVGINFRISSSHLRIFFDFFLNKAGDDAHRQLCRTHLRPTDVNDRPVVGEVNQQIWAPKKQVVLLVYIYRCFQK